MIFRRALLHELIINAAAVFTILLAISLTTLVIRLLGQAASGSLASEAVLAFLGFSALNYLPVLLSLTVFIAVLLTLTRSYQDSEMVVWFCAGQSLKTFIGPVLNFTLPVVLIVGITSLFVSPWAIQKRNEFKQQVESRDDVSTISPGVFKESRHSDRVFFVESFAGNLDTVNNIFVQSTEGGKQGVLFAQKGYQTTTPEGDHFLVLQNGRRYDGTLGSANYRIVEFERYAIRIEPYQAKRDTPSSKALSVSDLLKQPKPEHLAELEWRISLPLTTLLLALLAIPLSSVNPRAGRSMNLMLALLAYLVYSNSLSIAQAWVAQGKLHPALGLWVVHGLLIVFLLVLFYRRMSLSPSILNLLRRTK
ncbi:MAG: LPS export ABC transporter permease LptF [Sulfuricellaceae bacterium]|nr:LPS export ABC transporter permease LptF [Sulfuricellaceae bacterium]